MIFANVLMVQNMQDYQGVRKLAEELGVECTLDPTITPMMDGDRSVLELGVNHEELRQVFRDRRWSGMCRSFVRSPHLQMKMHSPLCRAVRGILRVMCRRTAMCSPACSFRFLLEM